MYHIFGGSQTFFPQPFPTFMDHDRPAPRFREIQFDAGTKTRFRSFRALFRRAKLVHENSVLWFSCTFSLIIWTAFARLDNIETEGASHEILRARRTT
jgi:hypothetical protein